MNIRPVDLQVLIPRTIDVSKMASVNDQQASAQLQDVSSRLKQTVETQQHQVQNMLSSQHEGRVGLEDLERENKKQRRRRNGRPSAEPTDSESETVQSAIAPDPVLGHRIDIKT